MAKPLFFSQSHRVLGNILEYLRHQTNTVESSQAFQCSAASSCPCRSPRGMGSSPLPPLYVSLKIWRGESLMQMLRKITSFALKKSVIGICTLPENCSWEYIRAKYEPGVTTYTPYIQRRKACSLQAHIKVSKHGNTQAQHTCVLG